MILNVSVANKIATFQKRGGGIVCGNSDYKIKFAFDAEWNDRPEKTARFIWRGQYIDVTFTGDMCDVPIIYNTTEVEVGVYAGDLKTTTSARIPCLLSVLCTLAKPSVENDRSYANEAKEAADRAEAAAELAATYIPKDGVGIESIEHVGSPSDNEKVQVYEITLTDGRTQTFSVTDGKDGVTPIFKIVGGELHVSYDNGETWEFLSDAPKGEQGDQGVSIASIKKVSSTTEAGRIKDTYEILLTNGEKSTFIITNGKDGEEGTQGAGIVSIEKTKTDGLVDTYTITLTNGVTYTFTVTNGESPDFSVVLDTSLTNEGQAADAKAAGDKIKEIDNKLTESNKGFENLLGVMQKELRDYAPCILYGDITSEKFDKAISAYEYGARVMFEDENGNACPSIGLVDDGIRFLKQDTLEVIELTFKDGELKVTYLPIYDATDNYVTITGQSTRAELLNAINSPKQAVFVDYDGQLCYAINEKSGTAHFFNASTKEIIYFNVEDFIDEAEVLGRGIRTPLGVESIWLDEESTADDITNAINAYRTYGTNVLFTTNLADYATLVAFKERPQKVLYFLTTEISGAATAKPSVLAVTVGTDGIMTVSRMEIVNRENIVHTVMTEQGMDYIIAHATENDIGNSYLFCGATGKYTHGVIYIIGEEDVNG